MSRWRILVVVGLLALPVLAYVGFGSYYLWTTRNGLLFWWAMTACFGTGYILAAYWQWKKQLLRPMAFDAPHQWTERDKAAWKIVEAKAQNGAKAAGGAYRADVLLVDGPRNGRRSHPVHHPGRRIPSAA